MNTAVNKIFGIGLSKTGTSSLCHAMSILGYKSVHYLYPEEKIMSIISENDFLNDMPVQTRYQQYDKKFPNSKFILTVRTNMEDWLKSCKHQFAIPPASMKYRVELINSEVFDEHKLRKLYAEHTNNAMQYFKHREKDLLVLDIFNDPDPWQSLCKFLGKPIPQKKFPHSNKT